MKRLWIGLGLVCWMGVIPSVGCMQAYVKSVGGDTYQTFSKIYLSDYETAWSAALEVLKSAPLDVSNREAGFLQTQWIDNTSEKNLSDSYGTARAYLKAQYRVKMTVAKGFYNGKPSVKVTLQKEQMVQTDVLDGWRPVPSDGVDENTLLYRLGRVTLVRMRLARLQDARLESEMEKTKF